MSVTSVIMTRGAISESSFHSTEAFKGHNIRGLLTLTLIRKDFITGVTPNGSWDRQKLPLFT